MRYPSSQQKDRIQICPNNVSHLEGAHHQRWKTHWVLPASQAPQKQNDTFSASA